MVKTAGEHYLAVGGLSVAGRDLLRLFLVLFRASFVISTVWDVNLGGILAAEIPDFRVGQATSNRAQMLKDLFNQ